MPATEVSKMLHRWILRIKFNRILEELLFESGKISNDDILFLKLNIKNVKCKQEVKELIKSL